MNLSIYLLINWLLAGLEYVCFLHCIAYKVCEVFWVCSDIECRVSVWCMRCSECVVRRNTGCQIGVFSLPSCAHFVCTNKTCCVYEWGISLSTLSTPLSTCICVRSCERERVFVCGCVSVCLYICACVCAHARTSIDFTYRTIPGWWWPRANVNNDTLHGARTKAYDPMMPVWQRSCGCAMGCCGIWRYLPVGRAQVAG